jgi:TonB-linked SusC/RagA family outer membrane protein
MFSNKLMKFFLSLVLFAFTVSAVAQQKITVTGNVSDAAGPVIGVGIMIQGEAVGVITDQNGDYSITVPSSESVLEFSCIGYKTVTRKVGNNNVLNVILEEDRLMLDDVVVLGYGASSRKKDLSASVGIVKNVDELVSRPVSSTEGLLQGQIPGVTVTSDGGSPTTSPQVVIRGQGSKNGDSVLWVVDGIPGAPITSLNDIESITVLKDAASAAIYGAQSGAGGVILVTTKKAKSGTTVEYDGVYGIRNATNLIEPLNAEQEVEMRHLSYTNAGLSIPDGWNVEKNPWIGTTRTKWMDEIFRTAFYQRQNVSINVGTENFKNRLTLSMDNNPGVLVSTYNKSFGIHYNGSYELNKWLTFTEDLSWSQNKYRDTNTTSAYSGAILSAVYMPASAQAYDENGNYGGTTTEDPEYIATYGSNFADAHGDSINPLRILRADNVYNRSNSFWTTTGLQLANIIEGLKFNSRFTYAVGTSLSKQFTPKRTEVGKPVLSNTLTWSSGRTDQWKTENTLTYDRTFSKHTVGVLLSTTANHYEGRGFNVEGKNLSDETPNLQYISFAESVSSTDWHTGEDANVALVGRLAYSYDDRYFVTGSWRRDYAGRLYKDNNYGDFPAVTGSWKISNEKFFPKNDIVNLLKLRASWGRIGNLGSISMNYKSALLSSTTWNTDAALYGVENGTTQGTFWWAGTASNPDLTWETSQQLDFGIDMNLFNERLDFSFDFYDKKTYNLIQEQTTGWPQTIGIDPMLVNQGSVKNRGVEFQIGWADRIGRDWSYFLNANYSFNHNWVQNTGIVNEDGTKGVWTGGGDFRVIPWVYQTAVGEPIGSFYLIKTDGIFQSDEEAQNYVNSDGERIQPNAKAGDLKFVDYNGDGQINDEDRQYMGSGMPKHTFSFSGGFTWKNLSFSMLLQGAAGGKNFYAAKLMLLSDVDGSFNRSVDILDAWSPTNTDSNIPMLKKEDNNENFSTASDWYLETGDYLRIKNVTLSYDLTNLLRSMRHFSDRNSRLSVYFSGENLYTFTNYSGMDPEVGGYDTLKYPVSRILSFGVKLTY